MQEEQQVSNKQDELKQLLARRKHIALLLTANTFRGQRIETLMKRHSSNQWSTKKKQKMVRRHTRASSSAIEARTMLDQLDVEIAKRER